MGSKLPIFQGSKAVNVLRLASAGKGGETIVVGADTYELTTKDDLSVTAGRIAVDVHGGSTVKAQGTLQFSSQPADGDTVTIDGKVYTFQTTLTDVNGHVFRGANATEARDNLVAAINLASGTGTKYATSTSKHTTVTAAASGADMVVTAIAGGTAGNAIATTKTSPGSHIAWDGSTLGTTTAGVDPTASDVGTAFAAAVNASATEHVAAEKISANEVVVSARATGVKTLACTETLSGSNNAWAAANMYGGDSGGAKQIFKGSRVPNATEVALGNVHFLLPFVPTVVDVRVYVTATPGVAVAWDGTFTIDSSKKRATVNNGGGTDWTTSHTIEIEAHD